MDKIFDNFPSNLKKRASQLLNSDTFTKYEDLIDSHGENSEAYVVFSIAHEFLQKKEYSIAKILFSDLVDSNPYLINAYAGLGVTYFYLSDIKKSLKEYQKAMTILIEFEINQVKDVAQGNPIWGTSIPVKGLRIYNNKVFVGDSRFSAIDYLEKEGEELPTEDEDYSNLIFPESLYHFGNYCRKKRWYPEAIVAFSLAVKLSPDYSVAQTNLGTALSEFGAYYDAEIELKKAIVIDPTDSIAYSGLGFAYLQQGKYNDAKKQLKKAIELRGGKYPFAEEIIKYAYSEKKLKSKDPLKKDIFLSYASEDKKFVEKLAKDLDNKGVSVWLDEWFILPGDSITEKINSALKNYKYFVPILSNSFVNKSWPKRELSSAIMKQSNLGEKYIIPILIEECELPELLSDIAYSNFTDNDYFVALEKLVRSVKS